MRGSTIRVLGDSYSEFLEALQKLGELRNIARLIDRLSSTDERPCQEIDSTLALSQMRASRCMYSFWDMGWIEVREITRESKKGIKKSYKLLVQIDKISRYFEEEKLQRPIMAKKVTNMQKAVAAL